MRGLLQKGEVVQREQDHQFSRFCKNGIQEKPVVEGRRSRVKVERPLNLPLDTNFTQEKAPLISPINVPKHEDTWGFFWINNNPSNKLVAHHLQNHIRLSRVGTHNWIWQKKFHNSHLQKTSTQNILVVDNENKEPRNSFELSFFQHMHSFSPFQKKKKITPSFSPIYFMQWYSFLFDIKVYTLHVPGQGQLWRVLCIITYMSSQFNKRTNTEAIHLHKSLLTDSLSNYINFPCIFSC